MLAPSPATWTPKFVGDELLTALRWASASSGRVGPAGFKTTMPQPVFTLHDRIAEKWDWTLPPDPGARMRRSYSAQRVTELEQVLRWPYLYLTPLPGPAGVLKHWLRCKIYRIPFHELVRQKGWSRATAYRARDKALAAIAMGLERDGIPPR